MKKSKINRPKSLSVCLAVAKGMIDSFSKKDIHIVYMRKETAKIAKYYADQMDCTSEQLLEALIEYFVYVQMENCDLNQVLTISEEKRICLKKFFEVQQVNNLEKYIEQ